MSSVRIVHFSDIHIMAPGTRWRRDDWFNKRLAAWLNLRVLLRGVQFRHAETVLGILMQELKERRPDSVVFSGDATALGFEEELARAARLLSLDNGEHLPGIAVPGNHDYCTRRAALSGDFERFFAPWMEGERIDGAPYPFARRVGHVWLIGVNSATANRWAWDASGGVGPEQLHRLSVLLKTLPPGPRVIVTHYPVTRASGRGIEVRTHRLRDVHALADVARQGGVSLWLHGHVHRPHRHAETFLTPFPVICAGSSTQTRHWSYSEYTITGAHLHAVRRVFDARVQGFVDTEWFDVALPVATGT